ncbi:hypothetical protein [Leptolyngbya sp. O-77]|uniref:hypothetical protein n=1 Tax=Leptolyngbya sp. O-77 TaxID=1080068 RepID=UPI00074D3277|nr:hypothetical protein [Leptolyngbya sp. O-77]BAU42139.1 guanylate kinase [Leptolyngbya sp. O-77]
MLAIIFGVSGVGKSSLIQNLRNEFGWSSIPTYMTRSLRPGETEKISVSEADFAKMENENRFVCVNQIFGNKYGTPRKEIEIAIHDKESYWVLDFPILKIDLLSAYKYVGFVVLPQDEDQLVNQVKRSDRAERLQFILQDYKENYAKYHNQRQEDASLIAVINAPGRLYETSQLIYSLASNLSL